MSERRKKTLNFTIYFKALPMFHLGSFLRRSGNTALKQVQKNFFFEYCKNAQQAII